MRIFQALSHRQLLMSEENGTIILTIPEEKFQQILPRESQHAEAVLARIVRKGESRKELARRLNTEPSTLSAATSATRRRRLPRNVALASLLWLDPLPSPDEANHLLMELEQPGLFLQTYSKRENRRNWLIHNVLTYAKDNAACPCESWLDFTNHVLKHCHQELIETNKYCFEPKQDFPETLKGLADKWNRTADGLTATDYSIKRQHYLDRYREKEELLGYGGRQLAFECLDEQTHSGISVICSMFGSLTNKNSNIAREKLIAIAAALGCTYRETNEMLMESNRALLYPNNSNGEELKWIQMMEK